jgi:dolichol-phosphate mannosyltransferase
MQVRPARGECCSHAVVAPMPIDLWLALFLGIFGAIVIARMVRGLNGSQISAAETTESGSIAVILPVLDEAARIEPAITGLLASGPEVGAILVVDGGSRDETVATVARLTAGDARVSLIDASPIPIDWNGKAWGLEVGLRHAPTSARWIVTIDADVRPQGGLFAAMATHAQRRNVRALSVATRQELADPLQAILHPAMLATLIYRFGLPGREATSVAGVQANGQCFLAERDLLVARDVFGNARTSRCEDVTIARSLVAAGIPVGFYEAGNMVAVRMHEHWRETWCNWPRSLTLRDRYARFGGWFGLTEVLVVQALPLPVAIGLAAAHLTASPLFAVAGILTLVRIGVLAGSARAYVQRPWSYWLAPLADLPVVCALVVASLRTRHTWRGRTLVREVRG